MTMKFLFIHQNFPGQFPHVSLALAEDPANEVVCLGDIKTLKGRPPFDNRLKVLGYKFEP